jgi:hypothetical protein
LIAVDSVNSSGNTGSVSGSGIYLCFIYNLSFKFSTFVKNSPTSTIFFDWHLVNSDISCLALNNNSCPKSGRYPGLIYIEANVTISSSVFQGNSYDYFLGTYYREVGTIAFVKCVFDVPELNTTAAVTFSTSDCVVQKEKTVLGQCKKAAPTRTRLTAPAPERRIAGELRPTVMAAVVAICAMVIVVAAFAGVGLGRMVARRFGEPTEQGPEIIEGDES